MGVKNYIENGNNLINIDADVVIVILNDGNKKNNEKNLTKFYNILHVAKIFATIFAVIVPQIVELIRKIFGL
jgi:hypothetical protein